MGVFFNQMKDHVLIICEGMWQIDESTEAEPDFNTSEENKMGYLHCRDLTNGGSDRCDVQVGYLPGVDEGEKIQTDCITNVLNNAAPASEETIPASEDMGGGWLNDESVIVKSATNEKGDDRSGAREAITDVK